MKLSIITINRNNELGLTRTLESVKAQTYKDLEYLIIDGASEDGSKHVIEQNQSIITRWISEPDNGIYHAMNKGIRISTGEYCLFLNSGDWLADPTTLENVFAQAPKADIVAGDIYFFDTEEQAIRWHVRSPDRITAKALFLGTLPHQATFIRRDLFESVGLYNEQLKIASDWLFFLEALLVYGCSYHHHQGTVSYFNMDGISCDSKSSSLARGEQLMILQQKYPLFLPDYELLNQMEKHSLQWLDSREYRVYRFLERIGIIRLGVVVRRLKRVVMRTFFPAS